jgi:hypothetical protein
LDKALLEGLIKEADHVLHSSWSAQFLIVFDRLSAGQQSCVERLAAAILLQDFLALFEDALDRLAFAVEFERAKVCSSASLISESAVNSHWLGRQWRRSDTGYKPADSHRDLATGQRPRGFRNKHCISDWPPTTLKPS